MKTIISTVAIIAIFSTMLIAQEPVDPQPIPVVDPQPPISEPMPQPQPTPEQLRQREIQQQLQNDIWSHLEARGVDVIALRDRMNADSPDAEMIRARMRQSNVPVDMLRDQLNESFLIRSRFGLLKSAVRHMQRDRADELEELGVDPNQPRGFGNGQYREARVRDPEAIDQEQRAQNMYGQNMRNQEQRGMNGRDREEFDHEQRINRGQAEMRHAAIVGRLDQAGLRSQEFGPASQASERAVNRADSVGQLIQKVRMESELRRSMPNKLPRTSMGKGMERIH